MTAQVVEFARLQFALFARDKDGTPRRAHLETAARGGSATAQAELDAADSASPGAGKYLWDWFMELHASRGNNGFTSSPIGWEALESWARLTRRRPDVWEVAAIGLLDRAFMEEQARADGERAK